MKRIFKPLNLILVFLISTISFSCFEESSNKAIEIKDSTVGSVQSEQEGSIQLWEYDANADSMIQHQIPHDITVERVVKEFNSRYADMIQMNLLRVHQDTVFLQINDASYLTQRMGTTGAFAFMAELVYSLTEVPSIHWVDLDFEEGDHASPGVYRRTDFDNKL